MPSSRFRLWYEELKKNQDAAKDVFGSTREELVRFLGQPDDVGGTSRKYKTPSVYKYDDLEFFFEPWQAGYARFTVKIVKATVR